MKKDIKWGTIVIKGLEDGDFNKFTLKQLTAIENGQLAKLIPKEVRKDIGRRSGESRIGRKASEEHREKISLALSGKTKSEKHKKKISENKTGKKQSKEHIEKKKIIFSGEGNPMFGKNHSKKSRKKISQNHAAKRLIKCPHCNRELPGNCYSRYHGDNCKYKNPGQ